MDIAITGATVVPCSPDGPRPIDDATVAVEDGEIRYVGPAAEFDGDPAERIDGSDRIVLPGFVDAHAHTGLTLVRGGAQDVPEIEWMNDALAPLSRSLTAEDRIVGSKLGVIEALRSGVTTVCEYAATVADIVEDVYEPIGARVVATETINEIAADRESIGPRELPSFDRDLGLDALDRADRLFDRYEDHDRVDVMYGPQAVDMVSRATLEAVRDRSREHGRDVHIHVAQGERERLQVEQRYDRSSVEMLADLGLANERLLAAHLHGASTAERERLAESGVRMVGCPGSIAGIDGEVPPILEYREQGGTVGVGTDQAPGNGRHDVRRELRTIGLLTKCDRTDPRALPAWEALRLGTVGGARALGLDDRIGTVEEGKRADLVVVDGTHPSLLPSASEPLHTAVPNLVYASTPDAVETVLVGGEVVVRDGALTTIDAESVRKRAVDRATKAFDRGADAWRSAGSMLVDDVENGDL